MPVVRGWAKDLEDHGSDLAKLEAARAATRAAQAANQSIDLEQYVRECLDGVVGDIDLPELYVTARFGEAGADGFTDAQRAVYRQIEAVLVNRFRPLTSIERNRVGLALICEWNQRSRGWFHTSDGRYFASEADRRAHQQLLDQRAHRLSTRVDRIAPLERPA